MKEYDWLDVVDKTLYFSSTYKDNFPCLTRLLPDFLSQKTVCETYYIDRSKICISIFPHHEVYPCLGTGLQKKTSCLCRDVEGCLARLLAAPAPC